MKTSTRKLLAGFYIASCLFWVLFISMGSPAYKGFDWPSNFYYFETIKQSMEQGKIPYHATMFKEEEALNNATFGYRTDRFFTWTYTLASPAVLLLKFLTVRQVIPLYFLFGYSVGFLGLLAWARKLRLSPFSTLFFASAFFLNHAFGSRMSVGLPHLMGYFSIPLFLYLLNELIELHYGSAPIEKSNLLRQKSMAALKLSFLMAFIFFSGGVHVVFQMLVVAFVLLLCFPRALPWGALAVVAGMLMSSGPVLPNFLMSPYLEGHGHDEVFCGLGCDSGGVIFQKFPNDTFIHKLINVFVHLWTILTHAFSGAQDASWENTFYIGIIGVALLAIGIGGFLIHRKRITVQYALPLFSRRYLLGMTVILIFSIRGYFSLVYSVIQSIHHIPAIDRLPTRFTMQTLTYGILVATVGLDTLSAKISKTKLRIALQATIGIMLVACTTVGLWNWRAIRTEELAIKGGNVTYGLLTPGVKIYDRPDEAYEHLVNISWPLSAVSIVFFSACFYLLWRKSKSAIGAHS